MLVTFHSHHSQKRQANLLTQGPRPSWQWYIMLNLNKRKVINLTIIVMELGPLDIILMESSALLLDQCIVDTLSLLDSFKLGIKQIYYRVTSLESNFMPFFSYHCHRLGSPKPQSLGYVSYPNATIKPSTCNLGLCFKLPVF